MRWLLIFAGIAVLTFLLLPRSQSDIIVSTYNRPAAPHQTALSVNAAEKIAIQFWGGTRCQSVSYYYADLPDPEVAAAQWSRLFFTSRIYFDCSITFDNRVRTSFPLYCATVVHEFGHLNGRPHVNARKNVMFHSLSNNNIPKVCR